MQRQYVGFGKQFIKRHITESKLIFGFSRKTIFPLIFIAFGTGVCRPIFTSKLTKSVNKEETGSLLGVNNALSSIGQIITPILSGALIQYLASFFLPTFSAIFFVLLFILWIKGSKIN